MKDQLKQLAYAPLVFWKHGSFNPDSIKLGPGKTKVSVNPHDQRAFKKLVMDTARGRESTPMQFWREHAKTHPTATMLDIGANYGECLFNPVYQDQRCLAVEANPGLCQYLARSRSAHRHADSITIENALLGSQDADDVPFYFSPKWTGGGSGVTPKDEDAANLDVVYVKERTLDSILAKHEFSFSDPLIFKMDVEGFEAKVFQGFESLQQFSQRIGILEFDTQMISRSGESAEQLFEELHGSHEVFLTSLRSRQLQPVDSWQDLAGRYRGDFHCDLIVGSSSELFAPGWFCSPGELAKAA